MSDKVDHMVLTVNTEMHRIKRLFTGNPCLTLIVRFDGDEESDVVVSDDDMTQVMALVVRTIEREKGEQPSLSSPNSRRRSAIDRRVSR